MLEGKDLIDFSITSWYEKFKDVALKACIIDIPDELVERIHSDSFDVIDNIKEICSEEFYNGLKNAMNSLDNSVFVKDNWHAPTDAKMFSLENSLKVTNISDLLLFLIASDTIMSDFNNKGTVPLCFTLKPWISIHPASEFRCIVINNTLRGITPRDWPTYYAHYKEEGPQIIDSLNNFFTDNVKLAFPRKHYTFDVIIKYPTQDIRIIDFGPLTSKSNLYAFSWKEIAPLLKQDTSEEIAPVFRYLETDIGIMTKAAALQKFKNAWS